MEISFKSRKLKETCNSAVKLQAAYGKKNSRKIEVRLAILRAANNLNLVPTSKPCRRHQLKGNRKNQFVVDVEHPFRIIFEPNHNPLPLKEDEGIDLTQVTAIRILSIEDYH